ncbi:MAG: trypsin-like peptidase domain-containing protein [Clostridia bacterium]|nr:trypsin-like peptidase domain-containing protein [Clostridia bacterium]
MKKVVHILLTAVLSAVIAFFVSVVMLDSASPAPTDPSTLVAEAEDGTLQGAAEKLSASVVGISSVKTNHSFSLPSSSQSIGSGVFVSREGHILTNHHVVGDADRIFVTLENGRTNEAKRIWSDAALDIAVIRAEGDGFSPAPLGNADDLAVGETVLAIGNPLSLQFQRTVTAGIVSAKNRILYFSDTGTLMEDLIQTDASINPGNSGGPLINLRGEVVGINTVKARDAEGMGFAISANLCRPIVDRILSEGQYEMPYLGIYAYDRETAIYMGLEPPEEGLYISEVEADSPAKAAGLRKGDVITALGGEHLPRMASLREKLLSHRPGEVVELEIRRNGTPFTVSVTLSKQP